MKVKLTTLIAVVLIFISPRFAQEESVSIHKRTGFNEKKSGAAEESAQPAVSPAGSEGAVWPVPMKYVRLASTYGPRLLYGRYDFHRGVDFRAPTGTDVYSVLDGTVVRVLDAPVGHVLQRYGKFVVISHGLNSDGKPHQSAYLHLSEYLVEEGQAVKAGDLIGRVGKTGYKIKTRHLHFDYYVGLNDGRIKRKFSKHPLRLFDGPSRRNYRVRVFKENSKAILEVVQPRPHIDILNYQLKAGDKTYEVDFERRKGMSLYDEDNPYYKGIYIRTFLFRPDVADYKLEFHFNGDFANEETFDVTLTNAHGRRFKYQFHLEELAANDSLRRRDIIERDPGEGYVDDLFPAVEAGERGKRGYNVNITEFYREDVEAIDYLYSAKEEFIEEKEAEQAATAKITGDIDSFFEQGTENTGLALNTKVKIKGRKEVFESVDINLDNFADGIDVDQDGRMDFRFEKISEDQFELVNTGNEYDKYKLSKSGKDEFTTDKEIPLSTQVVSEKQAEVSVDDIDSFFDTTNKEEVQDGGEND